MSQPLSQGRLGGGSSLRRASPAIRHESIATQRSVQAHRNTTAPLTGPPPGPSGRGPPPSPAPPPRTTPLPAGLEHSSKPLTPQPHQQTRTPVQTSRRGLLMASIATAATAAQLLVPCTPTPWPPIPAAHAATATTTTTTAAAAVAVTDVASDGMTLAAARAAVAAALDSLQSAYSDLVRLDSCTAVEPLPDCLAAATGPRLATQIAASCARLLVALPIVAAELAYDAPAKRRRGVLGGLLGSLERAARPGGPSLDVADLEWLEEVEGRTTLAVTRLEALRAVAQSVVEAGAVGSGVDGGAGGGRGGGWGGVWEEEAEVGGARGGEGPVGVFVRVRGRLRELVYECLRDARAALEG